MYFLTSLPPALSLVQQMPVKVRGGELKYTPKNINSMFFRVMNCFVTSRVHDTSFQRIEYENTIFIFILSHNCNFFLQIAYKCNGNPTPLQGWWSGVGMARVRIKIKVYSNELILVISAKEVFQGSQALIFKKC